MDGLGNLGVVKRVAVGSDRDDSVLKNKLGRLETIVSHNKGPGCPAQPERNRSTVIQATLSHHAV